MELKRQGSVVGRLAEGGLPVENLTVWKLAVAKWTMRKLTVGRLTVPVLCGDLQYCMETYVHTVLWDSGETTVAVGRLTVEEL